MKKKLLTGLLGCFSFFLSNTCFAQIPIVDFAMSPTTACVGSTVQVTDLSSNIPTGWNYSLNGSSAATSTLQNPVVSYSAAGIYSISLIAINGMGEGIAVTKTIEIIALPQLTVTGNATICAGGVVTQIATGADSYLWSTGTAIDTETFSPGASATYSITGTNTLTGCSNTMPVQITVNPLPALAFSGATDLCLGSSLSASLTGADTYTWNSDAVTGNTISINPLVNTSYTLSGTNTLTGCSNSIAVSITVNSLPSINITGNSSVCAGSEIVLTASGADTYSWNDGTATDAATFAPTSNTDYTVTGTNTLTGCSNTATTSITAVALPALALTGPNAYCVNGIASQTVSGADSYLWSTGTAADTETFSPGTTTTYSVTGTNTLTGCSNTIPVLITVNSLPTLSTTGNTAICLGSSTTLTFTGADTYTWNGTASPDNTITLSPTSDATYTLEGTNSATGCQNELLVNITVNSLPTITIVGNTTVCAGSSILETASGADTYLWSDGAATAAANFTPAANTIYSVTGTNTLTGCTDDETVSVTVIAIPVLTLTGTNAYCTGGSASQTVTGADSYLWSTGTATDTEVFNPVATTIYSVTGTNTLTGCESTSTLEITVNALPSLSVSGSTALCLGSSITNTLTGADTYTWNGTSVPDNTISLSPSSNTSYTLEGTTAATGCSNSIVVSIVVNSLPTVSIAGSTTVCAGSSILETASGADTYLWSDGATTAAANFTPAANTVYSVTGTNTLTGCTDDETVSVTVIAVPVLTLTGTDTYCAGGSASQTVTGADSYLWSTGTATDTEVFNPSATTIYSVTGTNTLTGCASSNTLEITVNPLPVLAVSGNGSVCIGSIITPTLSGADTYTWNGSAVNNNTVTINITSSTGYTLEGSIALTGCTNSIEVTIAVNPVPTVAITGNGTVCAGSSVVQTASGADSYEWSDGTPTAAASFTPVANTVYTVTGTDAITGCTDTETVAVNVIALPVLTLTGTDTYCAGGSATQTVTGADTYLWSTGTTTDNELFNPASTTGYSVTGTSTVTGCSKTNTLTITVNPLPVLAVSGNGSVCIGSTITPSLTGATTYSWNGTAVANATVALNPTTNTSYTLDGVIGATGCSNTAVIMIAVNALPTITIAGNATVCSGSEIILTASGADSYLWNNGAATDAATFSPVANTDYTVTGTNTLTGCSSIATSSVNAIALPVLVLNGTSSYCGSGIATQTVSGADTYLWSTGTAVDTETFSPANTTTYSVTGTNTVTGCMSTIPVVITVNAIPTITVNSGAVCAGNVFTMNPTGASTYTYSNGNYTVIPVVNGDYTVTGTSAQGCAASNTAIASVTVNALPTVSINNATICAGTVFTIQPTGGITFSIEGNNANVSPVVSTSYTITSVSAEGCPSANTATLDLTVNALPTLTISGNSAICSGQSATLSVSGASTYVWSTSSISTSITPNPLTNTTYTATGTDLNGCVNTAIREVTVNAVPTVTVAGGMICQGSSFTLLPNGASTYTITGGTATVTPNSTTSYTVTGTSVEGCLSPMAVATVSVTNAITLTVSGDLSICQGFGTTLTATGATNYTWSSGGNTSVITPAPATNTTYIVTGVTGPCTASLSLNVTVNALPTYSASSSAPVICAGQIATLSVTGPGTYSWSTLETSSSITVSPGGTTTYTVGGMDANGCVNATTITQTVDACTGISNVSADVLEVNLYPNPNNGEFTVETEKEVSIAILNNLGQLVYSDRMQSGTNRVNLDGQANGIYFITLSVNNLTKTIKMIKN